MTCPYCGELAIWCENKEIYGRNYGRSYMCYLCKDCGAYVGCHNNSKMPLGSMANKELRQWRMKAHAVIDPLWKSRKYKRHTVYAKIAKAFGETVHIGESNIERCKEVIEKIPKIFK
jgi:zinc-finger-containing domain